MARRTKIACAVLGGYALTWAGGSLCHWLELKARSTGMYEEALRNASGNPTNLSFLQKSRPTAWVSWSVPLLPGLLLVKSSWHAAPCVGEEGTRLILYYGFGSCEICRLSGRDT